jgi:hypothetical protein
MKRTFCMVLATLCLGSAALAQTTSSGGQPAGNKPGTNTTGSYHHDNGDRSNVSGSMKGHGGGHTSTEKDGPNANTGK